MIRTPLSYRWPRAQVIAQARKVFSVGDGHFAVQGTAPEPYDVSVKFDEGGQLAEASCTCPDFTRMAEERKRNPQSRGLPLLHGILVCKHVLAACIQAQTPSPFGWDVVVRHKDGTATKMFNVSEQIRFTEVRKFASAHHHNSMGLLEANIDAVYSQPSEAWEESM